MGKHREILSFLELNDEIAIANYTDKVYESLKDMNQKEEKHGLWAVLIIFLYLILDNTTIPSFSIGPVTINDISVIAKILPLIFVYVIFNMRVITVHKNDVVYTLKTISEITFKQFPTEINKGIATNFMTRMFLPYSFSNAISKITSTKPHIITAFIGFPLLLPIFFIVTVPYIVIFFMLKDLYTHQMTDLLGKASFFLTLWGSALMLFYTVQEAIQSHKEANQ